MTRNGSAELRAGPADLGDWVVRFGLVELDLLATYGGASIPWPLRVPSFGRIAGERDVLLAVAGATLRQRALADEDGPLGLGDDLAAALAGRRGTVDLVLTTAGDPDAVVALIEHDQAVLCRQSLSDASTEPVGVRSVEIDGLTDALVGLIPPLPGAKIMPIRLPMAAARLLLQWWAKDSAGLSNRLYQIADRYGCSVDDLDVLAQTAKSVSGGGKAGAAVVSAPGKDVRSDTELSWVDCPAGRLKVTVEPGDDRGWISVNPLHPNELRSVIAELVALVRRHRRR